MLMLTFRGFSMLKKTPLSDYNASVLKARMMNFAGYAMPIEFKEKSGGSLAEHNHVRTAAGFFDACHVGVIKLTGDARVNELSRMVVADLNTLKPGKSIYSLLMNEKGGIADDTIITMFENHMSSNNCP